MMKHVRGISSDVDVAHSKAVRMRGKGGENPAGAVTYSVRMQRIIEYSPRALTFASL